MQRVGSRIVISPSDSNHFLECEHLTQLERGRRWPRAPERGKPGSGLVRSEGRRARTRLSGRFREEDRNVASIEECERIGLPVEPDGMRCGGADVIYQAVLLDDGWRGVSDFLVESTARQTLGAWSYEAWDTKLARHASRSILQLWRLHQGSPASGADPPDGRRARNRRRCALRRRDFAAYFRAVRGRFDRRSASALPRIRIRSRIADSVVRSTADEWGARRSSESLPASGADQVKRLEQAGVRTLR